jgi:hypothetical protein
MYIGNNPPKNKKTSYFYILDPKVYEFKYIVHFATW